MERFPFETHIDVRFAETDMQGIAHHSAFVVWFEVVRIDYLARFAGGYPALQAKGLEATTTEVHIRYRAPARFADRLRIRARCSEVRGARFRFEYAVDRESEPIADGSTGHACVDAATLRPTRVPAWLAEAIATAES